jgi:uncharacterized repeat protein (TIGR01451 family)/predicted ribosomally synthesized peptide with SipW-like signal peptide
VRNRIAAALAFAVFLVLVGTTGAVAYWNSQASASSTVTATNFANYNCTAPVKLINGGFETPSIAPDTIRSISNGTGVTGWSIENDNVIEIWRGWESVPRLEGDQAIELNGNGLGRLYQVRATTPGQVLHWSLLHRGRQGTDTMAVAINANGSSLIYQRPTGAASTTISTGTAGWVRYQGEYVVPAGQTSTRFSLVALSGTNATVGNLVDDVSFGTGPCLTSTSAISNVSNPGATTFGPGDVVEYTTTITNPGGGHALSSVFAAGVPAGTAYVAGSLAINGVTKSDTAGNDEAEIAGSAITARLGIGATASVGGRIAPDNTITVRFRTTIQPAASGTSLSFATTTTFTDAVAPTWQLSAVSPTLTTPVVSRADLATTLTSNSTLTLTNRAAEWVFRVANAGPSATAASIAVSTSGTPAMTGRTIEYNAGSGWVTAPGATFTVPALASGAGVDVRIRATVPSTAPTTATYSATVAASATPASDPVPSNNSATKALLFDSTAPTVPTGVQATRASTSRIDVTWTASTDTGGSGVKGYSIFRNGAWIADVETGTSYADTNVSPHTPYWYTVQAYDYAANISNPSAGDGAVTYGENTSYRIAYPHSGANNLCAVAVVPPWWEFSADRLETQSCASGTNAQWRFLTVSGDTVYIQSNSGTTRRWTTTNNTSTTDISFNGGTSNAASQWELTAYWDGATAHLEIRRASIANMCVDVDGAATAAGGTVQQYTCNTTPAQLFRLVQP